MFESRSNAVVSAFNWNPRPRQKLSPQRYVRRTNNFGDLLGPMIVRQLAFPGKVRTVHSAGARKLLSVGSVIHFATDGDCIWGAGINGKVDPPVRPGLDLDIRAVRGPRTAAAMRSCGYEVPENFGDPALLVPLVFPGLKALAAERDKDYDILVVPNLNDAGMTTDLGHVLDPTAPVGFCLETIARSRFVTGSSMHAVIVAEALGIPARAVVSEHERPFKYLDYYEGSGRSGVELASNLGEALRMGGAAPVGFDPAGLLDSFPFDLWDGPSEQAAPAAEALMTAAGHPTDRSAAGGPTLPAQSRGSAERSPDQPRERYSRR